ncbi:hypothetical protein A1QO_15620 [Vibrio genomosp. F10 str. ZF-129]|uniref:Uncharacterized protein n=1 Tax=Vibrio genomosp. F10 str. ZF-129 TaxID=1187848 RepID=A0A1E5BA22_9VIBR|nr:hypothetical protein [Vibrio genomosp. F10]OEE30759.1 hypothetical protein A1QO_15620 [Vibrio genomosp. F10 str. ZF-129]
MSRISLFEFKVEQSIREIANSLLKKRYAPSMKSGFMLVKADNESIIAKHITEVISERTITSPFGDTEVSLVKDYLVNEIEVRSGLIKVIDPTKSLSQFKQDLSSALNYLCSISPLNVDLKKFVGVIHENDGITVTAIEIMSQELMTDTTARMSIASSNCLMSRVSEYLEGKSYTIKKLKIDIHGVGTAELNSKGNIKLDDKPDQKHLYNVLRDNILSE